ncbi:hypothetical protein AK830_g2777 [Neonectria ditissima]|uniref:RING-type domain-containing protein n=1 Tax=Neonectria ditissima TaxID=78410 RepID=A0A0P7BQP7_9HYPO|nr:hypothetical protein AK830_g2777 [Neonectria ditissima]
MYSIRRYQELGEEINGGVMASPFCLSSCLPTAAFAPAPVSRWATFLRLKPTIRLSRSMSRLDDKSSWAGRRFQQLIAGSSLHALTTAVGLAHGETGAVNEDEQEEKDDEPTENWTRELGGAWVQFGDGATTIKVSLPSDFSAIRIINLPYFGSVGYVTKILSDVGVAISPDDVRIMKTAASDKCSAIVKVEDPTFAKTACGKLRTCVGLQDHQPVSIPVPVPAGSNFHQVDCRQVHCSWHRPARSACLIFESNEIARRVFVKFIKGKYQVLGAKATVKQPVARRNDKPSETTWVVELTGLADTVEAQDVMQGITAIDNPRQIEMGEPSYVADLDVDSTLIKSMLYEFGPLERWDVSDSSKGRRIKAQATFVEEAQARDAAMSLDKKALPFCGTGKLFVQLVTTVKFKVSTRVYDVVQKQINSNKAAWERKYIRLFALSPRGFYRILKLQGENRQLVAEAQKNLERIISGRVMRIDGKDLRLANLKMDGNIVKRLKKIEEDLGVVIIRDVRASQVRVFGPEASFAMATEALHRLIQDMNVASHLIKLDQEAELRWALEGGFKQLESQLGRDKVVFDLTSRHILIHGTEKDAADAKLVISYRETGSLGNTSNSQMECPVCLCEAEEPVYTSCNHVYCGFCFVNMCRAEASTSKDFCVACVGGLGSCGKALDISEIHSVLLSETFEDVMAASFASHVRRHPDQFRYCPTPDCSQVYRVASNPTALSTTFTCGKCLASTCTACHAPHPGTTCAEHKGDESGGVAALNKIKQELGIKDCPRCSTAMEKTEGCNHMTCKGCGIHICWICLTTFDESRACYDHMRGLHGGIGL